MPSWLITGASRGLGLGLVQALVADSEDNIVFATCRNPKDATELRSLSASPSKKGALFIVELNVTDETSAFVARREIETILGSRGLDYLINNAGIAPGDDLPSTIQISDLVYAVETNVGGPALVTRMFVPLLERGTRKVVVNFSSTLGSIGTDLGSGKTSYSISKMGLNMLTYKQSKEWPDLITFAVHPGWCKTDMGGESADLEVTTSVEKVLRVVTDAVPDCSGMFFDEEGRIVPW